MKKFIFGTFIYEYELIKQDRKTLSLTVTPELFIILKCPKETEDERIEEFLQKKWFWLEKQLSFFKKYKRKIYEKEYISGESYLYLGRQYKLIVKKRKETGVSLTKGKLFIFTDKSVSDSKNNQKLLQNWYSLKAEKVFQHRFEEMLKKFNYKNIPELGIREMKKRWGSFLNKDKIFLNPKLIQTPQECIDYVIVHELCHLKYKNHNSKFWYFLDEKYPKWEKTKEKLETLGAMLS